MSDRNFTHNKTQTSSKTKSSLVPDVGASKWALIAWLIAFLWLPISGEEPIGGETLGITDFELPMEANPNVNWERSRGWVIGDGQASHIRTTNNPPEFFNNVSRVAVTVNENRGAGTDITNTEDEQYEWTATDPDGDTVTYSLSGTQSVCFDVEMDTNPDTNVEFPRVKYNANTAAGCSEVFDYETQSSYNINLVASDGNGGTDTLGIGITVLDLNDPPTIDDELLPASVNLLVDQSESIDASLAASDQDGDTLGYRFAMSNVNVASYDVSGSTVTVTGEATGNATLSIIVVDGTTSTTKFLPVVVKDTNQPPTFTGPSSRATYSVFENSLIGTVVGDVPDATDPDQDTLSYEITGNGADVFSVTHAGKIIVAKPSELDHETRPSFELTLKVLDGFGGEDSIELGILVLDANDPPEPVRANPADQQVGLGGSADLAVSSLFTDPDGDSLTVTAFSHATSVVSVTTPSNTIVTLTGEDLGSTFVTVTVDDGHAEATVTFKVTVVPNVPPSVANPIDDMQLGLHRAKEIPLAGIFTDPDGDETVDVVEATTSDETVLLVSIVDSGETLWLFGRNLGEATATVVGEDNYGGRATLEFDVTVEGHLDNDAPVVAQVLEDVYIDDIGTIVEQSLVDVFTDEEDETLAFSAESTDDNTVLALIVEDDVLFLLSRAEGDVQVTVTATDSGGLTASQELTVFVGADPPEVIELDAITLNEKTFEEIDLTEVFEEGSTVRDASSSNSDSVQALLWDDDETLAIIARKVGEATVSVNATGDAGARFTAEIDVTVVEADNEQPSVVASLDGEVVDVGGSRVVDLYEIFSDPDGDQLTFIVHVETENLLDASVDGNSLLLEGILPGEASISLQAMDAAGLTTIASFVITVDSRPESTLEIGDISLEIGAAEVRVDLRNHFEIRMDQLSFDVEVADPNLVHANIQGSTLALEALRRGTTTLRVNAQNSNGRFATQDVRVNVGDSKLQASEKRALAGVGRAFLSSVSTTLDDRFTRHRDTGASSDIESRLSGEGFGNGFAHPSAIAVMSESNASSLDSEYRWRSNRIPQSFEIPFGIGATGKHGSVWLSSNQQLFEGEANEGEMLSHYLGFDLQLSRDFLLGATLINSEANGQYRFGSASESYEVPIKALVPYMHYTHRDNTSVWMALGMGKGELETIEHTGERASQEMGLKLGLIGVQRDLFEISNLTSGVKAEYGALGMFWNASESEGTGHIDVSRIRLVAENTWVQSVGPQATISPFLNVGLADERGDGQTGTGIETEAGVRILWVGLDLNLRAKRFTMMGNDGYSIRSTGITTSYKASDSGLGTSMSMGSRWGAESERLDPFSQDFVTRSYRTDSRDLEPTKLSRRIFYTFAYGIGVAHERYLLKPHVRIEETGNRLDSMRAGVELNLVRNRRTTASFDLALMHQSKAGLSPNSGVELRASMNIP